MFRSGQSDEIGPEEQILLENIGMATALMRVLTEVADTIKFPIRSLGDPTFPQRRWLFCGQKLDLQKVLMYVEDFNGDRLSINANCFYKIFDLLKDSYQSILNYNKRKDGIQDDDEEEYYCCVCMANPKDSVLPCSHAFCQECLKEWSCGRPTHTCPLCKDDQANNMIDTFALSSLSPEELYESLSQSIITVLKDPQCRVNSMSALTRWRMRRAFGSYQTSQQ